MRAQSGDLVLRNAEPADATVLVRWWNDGAVMAHAGFPLGLGTNEDKVVREIRAGSDDRRRRLILEHEGVPIGEMSYTVLEDGAGEIGIKICETDYQGKGLGRKALSLLISHLFGMGCPRIVLDTNLNNLRAQHVYESMGFEKTAVRTDSWTDQLGRPQSAVDYVLTPDKFIDFTLDKRL